MTRTPTRVFVVCQFPSTQLISFFPPRFLLFSFIPLSSLHVLQVSECLDHASYVAACPKLALMSCRQPTGTRRPVRARGTPRRCNTKSMATSDQVLQPMRWFRLFYRLSFCLVPSMNKHLLSHAHFHSQQH